MDYNYVLTVHYDGDYHSSHRYADAISAASAYGQCVDSGNAKSYATYNLLEPNGFIHEKTMYAKGNK